MQPQEKIRLAASILAALVLMICVVHAQETEPAIEPAADVSPLAESGKLIQFERDIAPVLRSRCLQCHGPDDAKNDFRVDDSEIFLGYIEAGDHESSSLFVDYLTTDDAELLMPPKSHGGPLSASELALLRVWIDEGAEWPAGATVVQTESIEPAPASKPEAPKTLMGRVWAALGFLHPATVHFPIALFMLGAGFVVLGWKWPNIGFQIPLACLLLGTATAIASTTMGWSFAPERGHEGWNLLDWDREIDVHRWSGLIVTITASIVSLIALVSLWNDNESLTKYWKIGLLVVAGMVGAVGHQGGELSYGKDFYPRMFKILVGDDPTQATSSPEQISTETTPQTTPESPEVTASPEVTETSES